MLNLDPQFLAQLHKSLFSYVWVHIWFSFQSDYNVFMGKFLFHEVFGMLPATDSLLVVYFIHLKVLNLWFLSLEILIRNLYILAILLILVILEKNMVYFVLVILLILRHLLLSLPLRRLHHLFLHYWINTLLIICSLLLFL